MSCPWSCRQGTATKTTALNPCAASQQCHGAHTLHRSSNKQATPCMIIQASSHLCDKTSKHDCVRPSKRPLLLRVSEQAAWALSAKSDLADSMSHSALIQAQDLRSSKYVRGCGLWLCQLVRVDWLAVLCSGNKRGQSSPLNFAASSSVGFTLLSGKTVSPPAGPTTQQNTSIFTSSLATGVWPTPRSAATYVPDLTWPPKQWDCDAVVVVCLPSDLRRGRRWVQTTVTEFGLRP
jgi:hypothetical protein